MQFTLPARLSTGNRKLLNKLCATSTNQNASKDLGIPVIGSDSLADENTEQKQLAGRNTSESNIVKHKQRNNFLGKVSLHFQMVHKLHNSIISWAFLCGFGWEVLAEWGQYPLSDQQEFQWRVWQEKVSDTRYILLEDAWYIQ